MDHYRQGFIVSLPAVIVVFLVADLVMVGLHLIFGSRVQFFNLNKELNFPTIYQGLKLLFASVIIVNTVQIKKARFLFPLALLMFYLSIDEMFIIHESLSTWAFLYVPPLWRNIENLAISVGYQSSIWIVYMLPAILSAVAYLVFALAKTRNTYPGQYPYLLAAIFSFVVVLVLEIANSTPYLPPRQFEILMILEETFEMLGATVMIYFSWSILNCRTT